MVELSNAIVFNDGFNRSFSRLIKKEFDTPITLQLVKLSKLMIGHSRDVMAVRDSLLDRYGKKNGKPGEFKSEEDKAKFFEGMDNLLIETFDTNLKEKLVLPKNIKISAEDVMALEDIIDVEKSMKIK